jgi:hypothetical protein
VTSRVPRLPPWPVVETENVTIDEYFGNASSSTPEISIAHVKSKGVWQEDWQVGSPAYLVNLLRIWLQRHLGSSSRAFGHSEASQD